MRFLWCVPFLIDYQQKPPKVGDEIRLNVTQPQRSKTIVAQVAHLNEFGFEKWIWTKTKFLIAWKTKSTKFESGSKDN